jgi:hypothetical protein
VYECQSPGDSSELPGYLDSSLPARNTTTVHLQLSTLIRLLVFFLSNPSRQRYSARELRPRNRTLARADRGCIGKVVVHVLKWVDEGEVEGGMSSKVRVKYTESIWTRTRAARFFRLPSTTVPLTSRGLDEGRSKGGMTVQYASTTSPTADTSLWPARRCTQPPAKVHERRMRSERERADDGDVDGGRMGLLLYVPRNASSSRRGWTSS